MIIKQMGWFYVGVIHRIVGQGMPCDLQKEIVILNAVKNPCICISL